MQELTENQFYSSGSPTWICIGITWSALKILLGLTPEGAFSGFGVVDGRWKYASQYLKFLGDGLGTALRKTDSVTSSVWLQKITPVDTSEDLKSRRRRME